MKKLYIYPNAYSDTNVYINNLSEILKDNYDVAGMSDEKNKGLKNLLKGDIFHFNWYESIDSSTYFKTLLNYYKRKTLIKILKYKRKKIVWTVHNNQPHNSRFLKLDLKFMKFLAKNADRINILCSETKNNKVLSNINDKIRLIPHGDYINNYKESNIDIRERYNIKKESKVLLFVGQISRYKNIDLLIEAFLNSRLSKQDYVLLICGNCKDNSYKEELNVKNYDNIIFDFNFIKDEEMEAYLKCADVLVAPYNKESSLNSGTLWMAMSYKKSMILPLIGCVKDIPNYNDLLYVYNYENKDEHLNELIKCFNKIKSSDLKEKGDLCFKYIIENQTWEKYKNEWIKLFEF